MYKENRKKIRSMEIGLLVMAAFALLSSCRGKTEAVLETVETAEAETEPGGSGPDAEKASGSTETVGSPEVSGSAKTFGSAREETNSDVMISSGTVSDVQAYEADTIRVHVCGAVVSPGVYVLPAASRVYAAIEAAGGMVPGAAEDYLNLADLLLDGDKLVIPFLSELSEGEQYGSVGRGGISSGSRSADSAGTDLENTSQGGGLVDLNQADRAALMGLPGIGEAKAEAILAWREEHGPFEKKEDIMKVPGIKEAAYEKLKDKITVR